MLFNNLRNFEGEEEALKAADTELLSLLNNKNLLIPDKYSTLLSEYRKKQEDFNSEISLTIKNQVENVSYSVDYLNESIKNLETCKSEFQSLSEHWENDIDFHNEMQIYENVLLFRKNINNLLDQIKYFLTISSQVKKLEDLYSEGEENYEYIHSILQALCELRDNVINKMNENKQKTEDLKKIFQEFEILEAFEAKFYGKLFEIVKNARVLAKKNPSQLINVIKIFEEADSNLENEGKPPKFKQKCLEMIELSISERFDEQLKDLNDVNAMLEKFKFTVEDLIEVYDHCLKCFPKKYDIFKVYEENYKKNIEKRVTPFLDNEEEIKKSYGSLINLLIWMDSYEAVLTKAGINFDDSEYILIRSRVKSYMPFFLDHIKQILADYCERATMKDRFDMQRMENIVNMLKLKNILISNFAEDIFHFVNQQLELLVGKLTGELYIELLRIITDQINLIQESEKNYLKNNLDLPGSENSEVSPMFKVVMFINNYFKCLQYTNETKQYCLKYASETQIERIEKIFMTDLKQGLLNSIQEFFNMLMPYVFNEIEIHIIPDLFTQKWLNEDLLESAVVTLEDYYNDLKATVISPLYYNKIVRLTLETLVSIYFDQFITANKIAYKSCPNFISEHIERINDKKFRIENPENPEDKKKKKKEKEKNKANLQQSHIIAFSNKEVFLEKIKKEKSFLAQKASERFTSIVGKSAIEKVDKMFKTFIDLVKISKIDLEGLFSEVFEVFQGRGVFLLESVLFLREDVDATFKQNAIKRYEDITSKMNKNQ